MILNVEHLHLKNTAKRLVVSILVNKKHLKAPSVENSVNLYTLANCVSHLGNLDNPSATRQI